MLRAPAARAGCVALGLHLSRLHAPAPRPHHRRVAAALLDDAASRGGGQLFGLDNGDFVLLLRRPDGAAALAAMLGRLFKIDAPEPERLLTEWRLPDEAGTLLAYVDASVAADPPAMPWAESGGGGAALAAMERLAGQGRLADLLRRQTAVQLTPGQGARVRPLFQEVMFSLAVLEAQSGQMVTDPFLLRHLAGALDARLLPALAEGIVPGAGPGPAVHVNLTLAGVLSEAFAGFARACGAAGAAAGVEVPLLEACADPDAFVLARDRLRRLGLRLVLDGVSHHLLMLTGPAALEPDLIKLDWSPRLPEAGEGLLRALEALGPDRVVLHRSDTEAALHWGMAQGISRFQGRHVDAMLAAGRIGACAHAGSCMLRQCMERAAATGPGGRAGCRNHALLDAAAPLAAGAF